LPDQTDQRSATAFRTAEELVAEVGAGHAAPSDIARSVLDDIQSLDGSLNCFASLDPDDVMAQAAALDQRIAKGEELGPLAGLPVSVKDLIVAKGHPTAFGSLIMKGNVVDLDAPVVERLRAAGAVILGKTTTSEFGCKAVGDSPLTGITRNPWNTDKTPGGVQLRGGCTRRFWHLAGSHRHRRGRVYPHPGQPDRPGRFQRSFRAGAGLSCRCGTDVGSYRAVGAPGA
jgi:hypothetical protein